MPGRDRKTIDIEGVSSLSVSSEPLGCCGGSAVYHVARGSSGGRFIAPWQTWRLLCDPERLSNGATFFGRERASFHRFRLCRACLDALDP